VCLLARTEVKVVAWPWLVVAFLLGEVVALVAIAVFVGGGER
jgi:hypothetical protein